MQSCNSRTSNETGDSTPLVIGLDGALLSSDPRFEAVFFNFGQRLYGFSPGADLPGLTAIDVGHLPYNAQVLNLIRKARQSGRPVYLASAGNEQHVAAVASHLGLFSGWFAGSTLENPAAQADCVAAAFGEGCFDYVGSLAADLPLWSRARQRIAVDPSRRVERKLLALDPTSVVVQGDRYAPRPWAKLLRIHQWSKNALIFVPLITAQRFELLSLTQAVVAFLAFSLAASGVYIVNDLVDLEADRKHPTKRSRPLADGSIRAADAMVVAFALMVGAVLLSLLINRWLCLVLVGYLGATSAYTFILKRKTIIDVVTLAMLYTLRVIGGAAAILVPISEWLLAFSMFIFVCLALVKRYAELAGRLDADLPDVANRDYRKIDLDIIAALAAASGFNAITVFTLYINSETVRQLYSHPQVLWLICPILMYWTGRILLLAHRRLVNEDPILFAVKDRVSMAVVILVGIILVVAR